MTKCSFLGELSL